MSERFIGKLSGAFSKFKALFQKPKEQPIVRESSADTSSEISSSPVTPTIPTAAKQTQVPIVATRPQRFWNIGLDFGTAYTKCIVRNLGTQAFLVPLNSSEYLLPSEVFCDSKFMWVHGDDPREENPTKVLHLKMALADISSGNTASRWVEEFMRTTDTSDYVDATRQIEALTMYFLARVIHRARAFILTQSPDFSQALGDSLTLNMAVPVAHAQNDDVSTNFQRCLKWAFLLAREADLPRMSAEEVQSALMKIGEPSGQDIGCYLYPEVSANLQSYIKSPARSPGIYLFMDVGAGTVDLSIFIYHPVDENDRPISYPSAGVIPLGSSQIEMRAVKKLNGGVDQAVTELQETIRLAKEGRGQHNDNIKQAIRAVEIELEDELFDKAAPTLGAPTQIVNGRRQIHPPEWARLKILIGGGGSKTPLYRSAINRWFMKFNRRTPQEIPIPLPETDLRWPPDIHDEDRIREFTRFSVAYGLSFDKANLDQHRFPRDMPLLEIEPDAPPDQPQSPTKDEC